MYNLDMVRRHLAGIDQVMYNRSLILGRGSTSNNFHQLASNNGLTGSIVDDLEFVDHISSVLRGVLHERSVSVLSRLF